MELIIIKQTFSIIEIQKGILRQGWGYKPAHNLRLGKASVECPAKKNFEFLKSEKR